MAHVNVLGFQAALAAYTECDEWLQALLSYLAPIAIIWPIFSPNSYRRSK
ncbi:MAG: hypothetical protein R3F37_05055 [Candidatus Competibacteraceae bacterium]